MWRIPYQITSTANIPGQAHRLANFRSDNRAEWIPQIMWCLSVIAAILLANGSVEGQENFTQPRWLSEYMPNLLERLEFQSEPGTSCTKQGALYKQHLKNNTLWAVTMHDASAFRFDGLIAGGMYHFGSYDACISINIPNIQLAGQYCVVNMEFRPLSEDSISNHTLKSTRNPFSSIWKLFEKTSDPRIANKDVIKFALCIPSGCSPEDLQTILNKQIVPAIEAEGLSVSVKVKDSSCITLKEETNFDAPALIYLSVLGLLFFVVMTVSFIHGYKFDAEGKKKFSQHWLSSFSTINAGMRLTKNDGPPDLTFLSGMKVISMFLIIFGHRYLTLLYVPTANVTELEQNIFDKRYTFDGKAYPIGNSDYITLVTLTPDWSSCNTADLLHEKYGDFFETILFNGPIIVNTFLLISGFLTYLKILKEIEKGRPINVFVYTYYRWVRISCVYLAVILFSALIMPHFIPGPGWKTEGLMRNDACRRNWWTHILYINNYYRADEECILPGWYLAVDMQMFLIATTLGYIVSKWRIVEVPLFTSLFIISVAVPAIVTYFAGYGPIIRFYLSYLPSYWREPDYVESYTKTHMRASPYVMGMITAKIYFKLKEKKFTFSGNTRMILALVSTIMGWGTVFSAWPFFESEVNPSRLVSALYSSLSKVSWTLSMSILIIGQSLGGYGFVISAMGNRFWAPFNKLTLCALIIHPMVQVHMFLRMRQPLYVNGSIIAWSTAGDIAVSYFIAMFLYFFIEAPISTLNGHILRKLFLKSK